MVLSAPPQQKIMVTPMFLQLILISAP